MPHPLKTDPRIARLRRDRAIGRNELRIPTSPREASAGVTSAAIKTVDPATRAAIDAYLAKHGATQ